MDTNFSSSLLLKKRRAGEGIADAFFFSTLISLCMDKIYTIISLKTSEKLPMYMQNPMKKIF